ncbi:uncharacterized protein Gasu_21690 [Galdieria sulphuraria]|uniref:Uncharacterized protein n=1 Tax=Galdieria sulphuraria TaxID=130081 RepID=M2W420_GALSU|nr:uncharacterized protein Gasu_21690 [Galdieria sulphuraria]EME30496.1 hypothetical protein Gasu_21690 [Galdieria sulphuraria]|eukprot:XP_005707016.1 hypothetical protein Gasu_21690 [Galdieria sulphuraria]
MGREWKRPMASIGDIVSSTQLCNSLGSKLSKLVGRNTHYLCQESFLYRNNLIWVSLFDSFGIGNRELTSEEVVFNHCSRQTPANNNNNNNNRPFVSSNSCKDEYNHGYSRLKLSWKQLFWKWFSWKKVWRTKSSGSVQSLLLTSSIGLAAMIASDVEPKRTDTGEKVSYGPHSSALLNAAARHGAGSAPPHETGIGLIPGRILKLVGWSLAQLVGIGLIWLMVHHPSSTGIVALIGLLLFATNPSEASFLQWIKTQAPILARHKEAKIDKLRVRIAPYLFNLQDWTIWNVGICTVIHVRDFADYVYIYVGILGRWILLGWWKDPEFVFE